MIEKPRPELLTLSKTLNDGSILCNRFLKARKTKFGLVGTQGLTISNILYQPKRRMAAYRVTQDICFFPTGYNIILFEALLIYLQYVGFLSKASILDFIEDHGIGNVRHTPFNITVAAQLRMFAFYNLIIQELSLLF